MPEKCRVNVVGFDPMLVKGYIKTGERALWWYLPDQLFEDYQVKPGDTIKGTLYAIYNPKAEKVWDEAVPFAWPTTRETGMAVLLQSDVILKYQLTAFHFLELVIEKIVRASGEEVEVYPGEEKLSAKFWPEDKMKLHYSVAFAAP
jgi:hypothetical protein